MLGRGFLLGCASRGLLGLGRSSCVYMYAVLGEEGGGGEQELRLKVRVRHAGDLHV